MKQNIIVEKTYHFAVEMTAICKILKDKKEYHLASQLIRSATSVGANVREATAAQTKRDFIAKMSIASKEAREANYWINLVKDSHLIDIDYGVYIRESEEIIKILTAILKTAKSK
jgi:four helix bundle protein